LIVALYSGDNAFASSDGTLVQTVNPVSISSAPPAAGPPTGSVSYYVGAVNPADLIGTGTLSTNVNGVTTATFGTNSLLPGTYTITAVYGGDTIYAGSTSNVVSQTVYPSIIVLDPAAGGALTLSGNASINLPGGVFVDSSSASALSASGNAQVTASVIDVHGGVKQSGKASFSLAPVIGAASLADPLASLTPPSTTGMTSCGSVSLAGNATESICQGIYSQITVSGSAKLTMNPGIYIIKGGGFTVTGGASVSGTGVMIYNAGSNYPSSGGNFGGITFSGNGTFNVSAPASGPYNGILIFQSRQDTRALSFSGNAMSGMNGMIYAASAVLSLGGNAQLQSPLDVDMLNLNGNVALTQMAAGSDGAGDVSGIANTLLAGNLYVYINDPSGLFTADELARIQDAINAWDAILTPYNVTITDVSDPTLANIVIDTSTTSACGGMSNGVLGCYNEPNSEITLIQGWNWYAGSDSTQIGASQYDFETTMLHELGHALGLGGSTDPTSPMYEVLAAGVALRTVTTQDLNIPDPPEGADPQMAVGFRFGSTPQAGMQNGIAALLASQSNLGLAGLMALPQAGAGANSPVSAFTFQPSGAAPTSPPGREEGLAAQGGPQASLVVQGIQSDSEHSLVSRAGSEPTGLLPAVDAPQSATEQPALDQPALDPPNGPDPVRPVILDGGGADPEGNAPVTASVAPRAEGLIDSALDEVAWAVDRVSGRRMEWRDAGIQPGSVVGTVATPLAESDSSGQPAGFSARCATILLAASWFGRMAVRSTPGNRRTAGSGPATRWKSLASRAKPS
jgi:hypothetical protein